VIYDKAGAYWKTVLSGFKYAKKENGETTLDHQDFLIGIDEKQRHATFNNGDPETEVYDCQLPLDKMSPSYYTETNLRQLSK